MTEHLLAFLASAVESVLAEQDDPYIRACLRGEFDGVELIIWSTTPAHDDRPSAFAHLHFPAVLSGRDLFARPREAVG